MAQQIAREQRVDLASATREAGRRLHADAEIWRQGIRPIDTAPSTTDTSDPQAELGRLVRERCQQQPGLSAKAALDGVFSDLLAGRHTSGALSLSSTIAAKPNESFDDYAMRIAAERGIPLRDAAREAAVVRPDLASAR